METDDAGDDVELEKVLRFFVEREGFENNAALILAELWTR